jgi:hypothetical protein
MLTRAYIYKKSTTQPYIYSGIWPSASSRAVNDIGDPRGILALPYTKVASPKVYCDTIVIPAPFNGELSSEHWQLAPAVFTSSIDIGIPEILFGREYCSQPQKAFDGSVLVEEYALPHAVGDDGQIIVFGRLEGNVPHPPTHHGFTFIPTTKWRGMALAVNRKDGYHGVSVVRFLENGYEDEGIG